MVGLDVTQQVIMTPQFFEEVFKVKKPGHESDQAYFAGLPGIP
jgi:inosine-uridine nucleoside N-ribohydrolase